LRIINEVKLDFDDVLICPKRSETGSRADVNLYRTFKMLHAKCTMSGIPIIAANLDTTGTIAMEKALSEQGLYTCLHKFYKPEQLISFFKQNPINQAFCTIGITDGDFEKLKYMKDETYIHRICIDAANGYTKYFVNRVQEVRKSFPKAIIMAGNVATGDMTQELLVNGADIVKIGIGPGAFCETRKVTGVGYPQLSAIIECSDVAHGCGGHVCSDGGCKTSGDIAKAFGAGADFVMLGNMLSGTDECEGLWTYEPVHDGLPGNGYENYKDVKKSLRVYGMSSKECMDKYYGGVAEHRSPEGKSVEIQYKGPVKNIINQILGGLRSTCTYIGTDDIKSLSKCTTFVRIK